MCLERPNYARISVSDISTSGPLNQTGHEFKFYLRFCSLDSSGNYGNTPNAFIFSLRNKEELHPFKSMVITPQLAIYKYEEYGPTFGGGWDIYIADNANDNENSYNHPFSYKLPEAAQDPTTILAGTRNFSPDDWEVFYLE